MQLLLQREEQQAALELAERYPDDMHPELPFGRVLALLRLGRKKEARQALAEAHERLPKVLPVLRRKSVRKPELLPGMVSIGGEDQAWLYREHHRALWENTPGALEWLKKFRPDQ